MNIKRGDNKNGTEFGSQRIFSRPNCKGEFWKNTNYWNAVGIPRETIESISINEPYVVIDGVTDYDDPYGELSQNEKAALHIVEYAKNPNLLIETVLDLAKSGGIGGKWFNRVYPELNSIMERTMQCRIGAEWDIIPIFDENLQTSEKETFIEKKLEKFGFNRTLTNYKDALKKYPTDYKGSISSFRATFESLVDDIIESKGETLKSNQKDKLAQLKKWGILKELEKDNEFKYSYNLFGLLSHYGPHKELPTEEVANFLFTSTLAFIWFLINRFEYSDTKR